MVKYVQLNQCMIKFRPFDYLEICMKEKLELIVIGDDTVRETIFNTFSTSPQERNRAAHNIPFPSNPANEAIDINGSTSATFTLNDKPIRYGIHEYTNHPNALNSDRNNPYLLKEYLSVVVCIDATETGLDRNRFNAKINQLKNIRGNQPFNIILISIITNRSKQFYFDVILVALKETYPELCRNAIYIYQNDLNNPEYTQHLSATLNITLATPIYNEVQNCITLLHKLENNLAETPKSTRLCALGTPAPFDMNPILNILQPALSIIGTADANAMDSLRAYFDQNRDNLQTAFDHLKYDLDLRGVRTQTYISRIFLNVLCSIAAIFASLTIVGIPFVYYALSQNSRYHNNCLKFFATNNIDTDRASIVKVEDEMNRTVLKAH